MTQGEEHDGIIVKGLDGGNTYVAFEPEQIKSATDNIGTFDSSNPDIRYSERDYVPEDRELLMQAAEEGASAELTAYAKKVRALEQTQTGSRILTFMGAVTYYVARTYWTHRRNFLGNSQIRKRL